jgi:hypothetical protein
MRNLQLVLLLFLPMAGLWADDDPSELYTCSFTAHTPVGDLSGTCTTQSVPAQDVIARWVFTLTFDTKDLARAAKIQPETFYDMVRGQCLEDGSFTNVMPLWGDFVIKPDAPDYVDGDKACTPLYQVAPNKITLTRTAADPFGLQFIYEESPADIDAGTGLPTQEWMAHYFDSFRRLQLNSQNASSGSAQRQTPNTPRAISGLGGARSFTVSKNMQSSQAVSLNVSQ